MIKINLLEVEKERRTKATPAGAVPTTILAIAILGITALVFLLIFFRVSSQLTEITKDVAVKQAKKKELEPYIKRVDELEKRRNELALKNDAIETLRSQRTIPVHVLDEVSRALPEYLWVTNMVMKGTSLAIDGETLQEQAIPAFMNSLEASEFIALPPGGTGIVETKVKSGVSKTGAQITTFKLLVAITNPFKPKEPEGGTTTSKTTKTTKKK
jgi:type IV pilus assembly protein PilN